jgi:hypothetical protein
VLEVGALHTSSKISPKRPRKLTAASRFGPRNEVGTAALLEGRWKVHNLNMSVP